LTEQQSTKASVSQPKPVVVKVKHHGLIVRALYFLVIGWWFGLFWAFASWFVYARWFSPLWASS